MSSPSRSPSLSPSVHIAMALLKASKRRRSPSPEKLARERQRKSPRLAKQPRKPIVDWESDSDEMEPTTARKSPRAAARESPRLVAQRRGKGSVPRALEYSQEAVVRAGEGSPNFKDELVAYICTNGLKASETYRHMTREDDRQPVYAIMAKAMRLCEAEKVSGASFLEAMKELREGFGILNHLWKP